MESLIVPIGMPVTIITIIFVIGCVVSMLFAHGSKYPKQQTYTLDQKWTHEPLLLSATEDGPVAAPEHGHGDIEIGGSAHGKW